LNWRRIAALAVPLVVLFFVLGFVVALEVQRGPNWRLELDAYVADETTPTEMVAVRDVGRARRPWRFTPAMGVLVRGDGVSPTFPPEAVRCALVERRGTEEDGEAEPTRQIIFLVRHSDTLYHVGWLAYEGPEEPFGPDLRANLTTIGCNLDLNAGGPADGRLNEDPRGSDRAPQWSCGSLAAPGWRNHVAPGNDGGSAACPTTSE